MAVGSAPPRPSARAPSCPRKAMALAAPGGTAATEQRGTPLPAPGAGVGAATAVVLRPVRRVRTWWGTAGPMSPMGARAPAAAMQTICQQQQQDGEEANKERLHQQHQQRRMQDLAQPLYAEANVPEEYKLAKLERACVVATPDVVPFGASAMATAVVPASPRALVSAAFAHVPPDAPGVGSGTDAVELRAQLEVDERRSAALEASLELSDAPATAGWSRIAVVHSAAPGEVDMLQCERAGCGEDGLLGAVAMRSNREGLERSLTLHPAERRARLRVRVAPDDALIKQTLEFDALALDPCRRRPAAYVLQAESAAMRLAVRTDLTTTLALSAKATRALGREAEVQIEAERTVCAPGDGAAKGKLRLALRAGCARAQVIWMDAQAPRLKMMLQGTGGCASVSSELGGGRAARVEAQVGDTSCYDP